VPNPNVTALLDQLLAGLNAQYENLTRDGDEALDRYMSGPTKVAAGYVEAMPELSRRQLGNVMLLTLDMVRYLHSLDADTEHVVRMLGWVGYILHREDQELS